MKRLVLALSLATLIFGAVYGLAASLNGVGKRPRQAVLRRTPQIPEASSAPLSIADPGKGPTTGGW